MTRTTEDWHYSPLPKGSSRALTVPSGRGGGRSGGPSGQIWTRTQDGDLQSGTDRQGPWRSWELWKPWRCRELRRPWCSWELWRPWRSWELWRPWRCRELRRPWQMDFGALASVPSARPLQLELLLPPPPPNFPREVRGYQEPSGAKQTRQYKTRQESPPGPDGQDRTAHRNQKPSWAGLEAEASSGHDMTSGALTGSLSNRFHLHDKGAGG